MAASRVAACALPVKRTLYNTTVYAKLFTVKYRMSVKLPVPFSLNTPTHRPHTRDARVGVHVHKMCVCCVRDRVCRLLCGAARTTLRGSPPG